MKRISYVWLVVGLVIVSLMTGCLSPSFVSKSPPKVTSARDMVDYTYLDYKQGEVLVKANFGVDLEETLAQVIETIHQVLEKTPPELAADVGNDGVILTGGGAKLYGMDKLITEKTGIKVNISEDPIGAVAMGTGKALEWVDFLASEQIDPDSIRMQK